MLKIQHDSTGLKITPEKLYYKIGEISELLELRPSVLRYWEQEFKLKTSKSKSQQRLYELKDVERILEIKKLLYDERFTLEGAKKYLNQKRRNGNKEEVKETVDESKKLLKFKETVQRLKKDLVSLAHELKA